MTKIIKAQLTETYLHLITENIDMAKRLSVSHRKSFKQFPNIVVPANDVYVTIRITSK